MMIKKLVILERLLSRYSKFQKRFTHLYQYTKIYRVNWFYKIIFHNEKPTLLILNTYNNSESIIIYIKNKVKELIQYKCIFFFKLRYILTYPTSLKFIVN